MNDIITDVLNTIDVKISANSRSFNVDVHGGILHSTLNPNEMKCNYCGWTRIEMNLGDYVASKGYVGP